MLFIDTWGALGHGNSEEVLCFHCIAESKFPIVASVTSSTGSLTGTRMISLYCCY